VSDTLSNCSEDYLFMQRVNKVASAYSFAESIFSMEDHVPNIVSEAGFVLDYKSRFLLLIGPIGTPHRKVCIVI